MSQPVPVLAYHGVGDQPRDGTLRWSVSPARFAAQMALLRARRRTPMTVSGYAAVLRGAAPLPPRPVLVTFDDGFADLAGTALPILRGHGLVATAYVITARIGKESMVDWRALAELRGHGIEIGSHGHTHRALDCLRPAEVHRELTLSRSILAAGLGEPVRSFAYPYGYSSAAVRRLVRAAGYTSACGVKNAVSHPGDDAFAIARVLIERDTPAGAVDALLDGRGWPPAWRGEHLRTRGWRAYRRARELVRR